MAGALRDYFNRVFVVDFERDEGCWRDLLRVLAASDWPFGDPLKVPAVHGDALTVPVWWKPGGREWGRMMSHARIIEDCIRDGLERVLILETGIALPSDTGARIARFLDRVPPGWDQLYFGGRHRLRPHPAREGVLECVNVGGTYAYALSRTFMPRMYRYILNAHDYLAHPDHGMDQRLGALHETGTVKVYAPVDWIVAAGGDPEARGEPGGEPARSGMRDLGSEAAMPMVVVLGLHEGRAHEVAGLLKSIGVHFGHNLRGYRVPAVEDAGLSAICERAFPFPTTRRRLTPDDTAPLLHDWCRLITHEAASSGRQAGACYPHLCAMADDMRRAWRHVKIIDVDTGLDGPIDALLARSAAAAGWLQASRTEVVEVQTFLHARRRDWLSAQEHVSVDPDRVASDRGRLVAELQRFLGAPDAQS